MIKFGEMSSEVQKANSENTDAFKEIKPQEEISKETADDYWENLFNGEIDDAESEDELLYDVLSVRAMKIAMKNLNKFKSSFDIGNGQKTERQ